MATLQAPLQLGINIPAMPQPVMITLSSRLLKFLIGHALMSLPSKTNGVRRESLPSLIGKK
jgi:hypothetical protein